MKPYIPHIITLINLFCGCCAVVCILFGQFLPAFLFIFIGGIADYTDGMAARWLEVKSPLGKELDSIADMVTFGVVPGAIIYALLSLNGNTESIPVLSYSALPAFILSVFSGLRLARFNLDTRQTDNFIGLATPSSTMFVVGLMMIYHFNSFGLKPFVSNPYFLYSVIVTLSYLLVAEFPMFGFKFKDFNWKGNEIRFIFLATALAMFIVLQEAAFSFIILIYILFAIIDNVKGNKRLT